MRLLSEGFFLLSSLPGPLINHFLHQLIFLQIRTRVPQPKVYQSQRHQWQMRKMSTQTVFLNLF